MLFRSTQRVPRAVSHQERPKISGIELSYMGLGDSGRETLVLSVKCHSVKNFPPLNVCVQYQRM